VSARPLDVSRLPAVAYGPRATVWWGTVGLLAIEGTMFGLLVATYVYLRLGAAGWPPFGTPAPRVGAASANMALLILTLVPMIVAHRAALREQRRPIALALAVCVVAGLASLTLRGFEFAALGCRWDSHAYGSIVWAILAMHTAHLVTSTLENVLLTLLMLRGPLERKHFVDANVNAVYWYFVVAAWLPLYLIVFWGPRLT
jgi:heme/copper-type cytochrome/quinol oxidase subunit 3